MARLREIKTFDKFLEYTENEYFKLLELRGFLNRAGLDRMNALERIMGCCLGCRSCTEFLKNEAFINLHQTATEDTASECMEEFKIVIRVMHHLAKKIANNELKKP